MSCIPLEYEKCYGGKIKQGKGIGSIRAVEILHRVVREYRTDKVAFSKDVKWKQSELCG